MTKEQRRWMDERREAGRRRIRRAHELWRIACASDWARIIGAAVVVGGVLAASGGFGAGALTIAPRFAYWMALFLAGVGLGRLASSRLIPRAWINERRILAISWLSLLIACPMILVVATCGALMSHGRLDLARIWDVAPSTLGTTVGMVVLAFLVSSGETVTEPAPAAESTAPSVRFLARLPGRLAGADLWAVEAEDHYLRLHTSKGEDLILMRLADALAELEGAAGARVHRSWWVARAAVLGVGREDGRVTLELPGGRRAPVSRAYAKALRDAGWF